MVLYMGADGRPCWLYGGQFYRGGGSEVAELVHATRVRAEAAESRGNGSVRMEPPLRVLASGRPRSRLQPADSDRSP
jgi:hypothetical protein